MKKLAIFIGLLIIFTFSIWSFFNLDSNYYSTYTSAVCEGNTCMDYLFTCLNNEVVNYVPISGFVTFGEDWVDKRDIRNKC